MELKVKVFLIHSIKVFNDFLDNHKNYFEKYISIMDMNKN